MRKKNLGKRLTSPELKNQDIARENWQKQKMRWLNIELPPTEVDQWKKSVRSKEYSKEENRP